MEKEKRKLPYENVGFDILIFTSGDVITTSGGDDDDDYEGPTYSGSGSWT